MKKTTIITLMSLLAVMPVAAMAQGGSELNTSMPNEENAFRMPPIKVTPEKSYLDTYNRSPGTLYPTSIVVPYVNGIYAGKKLDLRLHVDRQGNVSNVSVNKGVADMGLLTILTDSFDDWKFSPLQRNGQAVPADALIEVSIVSNDAP